MSRNMEVEKFKETAYSLLSKLKDHIQTMPQKGNTCSECQRMCFQQSLNEIDSIINGTTQKDLEDE